MTVGVETIRFPYVKGTALLTDLVPLCHQLVDHQVAQLTSELAAAGRALACRSRCTVCCHQLVVLPVPEALYIADHHALSTTAFDRVQHKFAEAERRLRERQLVDELYDPTPSSTPPHLPVAVDYFRTQLPCPYLDDDLCTIYERRPMACR